MTKNAYMSRRNMWTTIGIVVLLLIAFAVTSALTAGFTKWQADPLKVNPDNLYSTVELEIKDAKTGDGITIDVDENTGAITFKGTADKDLEYVVGTVTLDKGTYTFTASPKTSNKTIYVEAVAGNQAVKADFTPDNVIEVAADNTEYTITVYIAEGTTLNNVDILPCIYAGENAVDFYE